MPNIYRKLLATGILLILLTASWVLLGKPYVDLWQDRIARLEQDDDDVIARLLREWLKARG